MTIAVSLKVNDGLVLATDSASTLIQRNPDGSTGVLNVYNNADKIFNLRKGLPIGAMTWGSGGIGVESISTLMKDLRRRLSGEESEFEDWEIKRGSFQVLDVAKRLRDFIYHEKYAPTFQEWSEKPPLGFAVTGYSSNQSLAEEFQILMNGTDEPDIKPLRGLAESGLTWFGEPEAITRLVLGFGMQLQAVFQTRLGVSGDDLAKAMEIIRRELAIPLVIPAMPIQDAIDLAEFLVDSTIQFSRFTPGPATVGGPIEIAAITKHEGFKWIKRKHYFSCELNPGGLNADADL